MRNLALVLLISAGSGVAGGMDDMDALSPAVYAHTPELEQYLREAAETHPALRRLHAQWLAQLERIPQATSLEDPMFSYGQFIQSDTNRFRLAVSQRFPWFGTLRLRGDQAAETAEAIFAEMADKRNRLIADVKQAYAEYAYLAAQIQVLESQVDILDQVEETVTTQFGFGFASEDALLRVHIEKAALEDELKGLERYRPALSARLALCCLGRSVHVLLPFPDPLPELGPPPDEATITTVMEAENPALAAARSRVEARGKGVELARKEGFPSITVEVEYMAMKSPRMRRTPGIYLDAAGAGRRLFGMASGGMPVDPLDAAMDLNQINMFRDPSASERDMRDDVAVMVMMNVPIRRGRVRAGIREAAFMQESAEWDAHLLTLELQLSVSQALFEYEDALRRSRLYANDLIPLSERVYEGVLTGYGFGFDAGLVDLLESEKQLLAFQLARRAALRDAHMAAAELEYLMGRPLGGIPDVVEANPGS